MRKTVLHKLFGVGRIPKRVRTELEAEEILMLDEGIGGSITYRNYRVPGKRYSLRRVWFTGSLVVTKIRIAAFAYNRDILSVPFDYPRLANINARIEPGSVLCLALDVQDFHSEQSGRIECRFRTTMAQACAGYFKRTA